MLDRVGNQQRLKVEWKRPARVTCRRCMRALSVLGDARKFPRRARAPCAVKEMKSRPSNRNVFLTQDSGPGLFVLRITALIASTACRNVLYARPSDFAPARSQA